jgi:hypothetical protein
MDPDPGGPKTYGSDGFGSATLLSSRPNWVPAPPHPQGSAAPPPYGSKGGDTPACGGGGAGGPNYDEGTDTLVLMYNPSTVCKERKERNCTLLVLIQPAVNVSQFNPIFLNSPKATAAAF